MGKELTPKVISKPQTFEESKVKKSKVIRKPDPSLRRNIQVATLNKIKAFLKEQLEPVYKAEIVKQTGVDYNSLNLALTMIKYKLDKEGRISITKRRKKNETKKSN